MDGIDKDTQRYAAMHEGHGCIGFLDAPTGITPTAEELSWVKTFLIKLRKLPTLADILAARDKETKANKRRKQR